jgi:hypothetical protein
MNARSAVIILLLAALTPAFAGCSDDDDDDDGTGTDADTDTDTDSDADSDADTGTADYCGEPDPVAGACEVSEELAPSDAAIQEIAFTCSLVPEYAASICAAEPGVECFFGVYNSFVFVFSGSAAVTALVTDACLEVPADIDWESERLVVVGLTEGTCGIPLEHAYEPFDYASSALHLDIYVWDPSNPWDENATDCESGTEGGVGLRVQTDVDPTVCLFRNPPCAG